MTCFGKSNREKILHMSKASAIQLPQGVRPLGKIEVLPNAIHTIAMQATSECYGVVGLTAPRLHNGQAVLLPSEQSNQGIQVRVVNEQIIVEVYVALEYGLRMSEIAHNIMSSVKFSIEKMLGVPVAQVNVNIQGLSHSPSFSSNQNKNNKR
ncbi:MAG: Asp23/Gls24 family envelope stress response protein [Chloroflexi bacterium]|nr:MAG: Asp23/Gls24 family envelope stress response protein [Chloroflexota bacterium]